MNAIPTVYKERTYRSRLEARWAVFFDLAHIDAAYEPFDLKSYIPDFVLRQGQDDLLMEIKPLMGIDERYTHEAVPAIHKIVDADWKGPAVVLGARWVEDADVFFTYRVGYWLQSYEDALHETFDGKRTVAAAVVGFCAECGQVVFSPRCINGCGCPQLPNFCPRCGFSNDNTGRSHFGSNRDGVLFGLWNQAGEQVRWLPSEQSKPADLAAVALRQHMAKLRRKLLDSRRERARNGKP